MRAVQIMLCAAALALGQARLGAIRGRVTGPTNRPLADAPVQATEAGGANYRARSGASGEYQIDGVPAGLYTISVTIPGFSFQPYRRPDVRVAAGESVQLDIQIAEGGSQSTLGDDPEADLASLRRTAPTGPIPRTPDGHPDLSGVWFGQDDLYPEDPDVLPWAAAIMQQRLADNFKDSPSTNCLPADLALTGPFHRKFVQTPALLVILTEDVLGYRETYLDGRGHPADWSPSWNGHSTGRWEGETLVVDRTGFNGLGWAGLSPYTEALHITERYRRIDLGHMEVQLTLEDPGTFRKPWNIRMQWVLAPGQELFEYVCGENNRTEHIVGK